MLVITSPPSLSSSSPRHPLRFHDSAGTVRRFEAGDEWHWDEPDGGLINRCLKHDARLADGDSSRTNASVWGSDLVIFLHNRTCRGAMSIVIDAVKVASSAPSLSAATAALVSSPRSLSALAQWRAAYLADPPARHTSALAVQVS